MNTDDKIEALTESVRAIGAQHLAMKAILRATLPFLAIDKAARLAVTTAAHDALFEALEEAGADAEFQQISLEEFEALQGLILLDSLGTAADRPGEHPSDRG